MDNIYISGSKTNKPLNKFNRLLFAKRIVLRDSYSIYFAEKHIVNINAWINPERIANNIGDYLSFVVVDYMCKYYGISLKKRSKKTSHLYAIGSILLGYKNAVIWGSGFLKRSSQTKLFYTGILHRVLHKSDFRAVRGPETLDILNKMGYNLHHKTNDQNNGVIFGDPAVLLPIIYPKSPKHKKKYVVVPHYSKSQLYKKENRINTFLSDWRLFIDSILEADLVISSSLHGIIIAESYGIPAVMLRETPSDDITKYKDWYYSTNRFDFPMANSVQEALCLTPLRLDKSFLENMQKELIQSFPVDLWE